MNPKIFTLIIACTPLLTLLSCQRDIFPENDPVDILVDGRFYGEEYAEKLPMEKVVLKIFARSGQVVYADSLKADGHFQISGLAPDSYKIQATASFSKEEFNERLGRNEDFDVNFSSSIQNIEVNETSEKNFALELISGSTSSLLIKQIYYAGSHASLGASFRDQFIEIYNNSSETQYADSLYIAEIYGTANSSTTYAYQAVSGQFDWSRSYGMPANINANQDYVYASTVLRIPGSGIDYPILPGESIIMASTAANHKSPYQGTDGKTISIQDPSLTVDLSQANFETYYAPYLGETRPLASDIDNPNVPNMIVVRRSGGTDLIMTQTGAQSWAIFRGQGMGDESDWKGYERPYADGRVTLLTTYIQIPNKNVLDAVELQSATQTTYPKRFTAQLDAGGIFAEGGTRSSNAVIRKTKEIVGGRRVLQDSNNSTEDFVSRKAEPKVFVD